MSEDTVTVTMTRAQAHLYLYALGFAANPIINKPTCRATVKRVLAAHGFYDNLDKPDDLVRYIKQARDVFVGPLEKPQ